MGFFHKIHQSDVFVFIDEVQFVKGSYCNRLKYKESGGSPAWLTLPVKYKMGQSFLEVNPDNQEAFLKKAKATIAGSYGRAPYYHEIADELFELFENKYSNIAELNIALVKWVCTRLEIQTVFKRQSEMDQCFGKNNQLTSGIVKHVGGTVYLSGSGARKYNDPAVYEECGVELRYQQFIPQSYQQQHGAFIEGLSIIDALMNVETEELKKMLT